jgi:MoaA/NifB/PqqE/SkfB family radical SAM enzyme
MTPELQKAMDDASIPFWQGGGAISIAETKLKSWRFFLECNSLCSLHCPTCTKGVPEGYDHQTGIMEPELMERILDKIQSENPNAMVMLYGNSEPWIHPRLAECISSVKRRGLNAQVSTNLNSVRKLDEVLAAQPDMIIISLSGFTQEIYERGHAGGNIEKVKANMKLISEANARANPKIRIAVNFHIYTDNQHEIQPMKEYAESLGIEFFTSYARAISMENAIQYNRSLDPEAVPFEVQPGRPDYNAMLPPISQTYIDAMKRVVIPPDKSREMYSHLEAPPTCPIGWMFCFIRHDGLVEMCACVADRRLVLGNYLDMTQDEMTEKRTGHAVCLQCSRYKLRYYFHLTDARKWTPPV